MFYQRARRSETFFICVVRGPRLRALGVDSGPRGGVCEGLAAPAARKPRSIGGPLPGSSAGRGFRAAGAGPQNLAIPGRLNKNMFSKSGFVQSALEQKQCFQSMDVPPGGARWCLVYSVNPCMPPNPMNFIGFGAMDVTRPYEFKGFGAVAVTKTL